MKVYRAVAPLKVLLLPLLLCGTMLIATFYPTGAETTDFFATSVSVTRASEQSLAAYLFTPVSDISTGPTQVEATVGEWYVTTDEYSDRVGNLCSIYNFCHQEWANARQWCVDNYNEGWPYGPVKDKYGAANFGVAVSMATAACCIRESSTVPDNMQNMGKAGTFHGSIGMNRSLSETFNILKHPAYAQGYGLIQFTFSNLQDLVAFCEASNLDPRLMETQLKFMAYQYYSNDYVHKQYEYLEAHNNDAPTKENVSVLACLHTTVIGMGSKPGKNYSKPNKAVQNILLNWGTARYPDFIAAAGGAYELLNAYATTGTIPGR